MPKRLFQSPLVEPPQSVVFWERGRFAFLEVNQRFIASRGHQPWVVQLDSSIGNKGSEILAQSASFGNPMFGSHWLSAAFFFMTLMRLTSIITKKKNSHVYLPRKSEVRKRENLQSTPPLLCWIHGEELLWNLIYFKRIWNRKPCFFSFSFVCLFPYSFFFVLLGCFQREFLFFSLL